MPQPRELMGNRRKGYSPDPDKLAAAYILATLVALLGMITMTPGVWEVARFLRNPEEFVVGRFALVVFFLGTMHLAYALYLAQLPDWSAAAVLTIATLVQSAVYAATLTAVLLSQGQSQLVAWLDLAHHIPNGRAAGWCFVMFCLTGIGGYFSGHVSLRWRRAYLVIREAHRS
jgi:hypothetical protein